MKFPFAFWATRFLPVALAVLFCNRLSLAAERPNVVFAFADDWGRYASVYSQLTPGGPSDLVSTPNFDRVAREGALFTQAYINAPSCTPCRSSLLSGQYFWRTGMGAILQGATWDDKIPSYPLILETAGYKIGHTYKVWSPGSPADQPHGGQRTSYNRAGRKFNAFSQNVTKADNKDEAKKELYEEVRQNFRDFLSEVSNDQPFCYWLGPTNCHRKWIKGSGKDLWGLDPDKLQGKLPKFLPDTPEVREDFCDYLGEVQAFDHAVGVLIEELERIGALDNTILVVSGDHGVPGMPRGKCNLYDLGTRVSLAIRWPKSAAKGVVIDDFVGLPDLAPTFVDAAGLTPPNVMTGRSLVPLLMAGKSGIVDAARDHVVIGRERHVAGARKDYLPYPQRAIRTNQYLYIRNFKPERWPMGEAPGMGKNEGEWPSFEDLQENTFSAFGDLDASPTKAYMLTHRDSEQMRSLIDLTFGLRPEEELYDVLADPDHLHNLAGQPQLADVQTALSAKLMHILADSGDPRVLGDGTAYDKPPFSGPVN
ncbi:MAG: sulfatase-like hydrolase/transferase [Planctomycetales bacterium]|nr:sulfatase-like hydrolase/transferase [Planctomycetales bacterium]